MGGKSRDGSKTCSPEGLWMGIYCLAVWWPELGKLKGGLVSRTRTVMRRGEWLGIHHLQGE